MSNKNYKFALSVATNAELCPNPSEYYGKIYQPDLVEGNYKLIRGIKSTGKVANVSFTNLTKDAGCTFNPTDNTLDAVDVAVCPLAATISMCRSELETSFLATAMPEGSNSNGWVVADFMSYVMDEMVKQVSYEADWLYWQGDSSNTGYTGNSAWKGKCDGFAVKMLAASGVTDVTATAFTASNIIANLTAGINALNSDVLDSSELRIYMNAASLMLFRQATASFNTTANVTLALQDSYLGIPIVQSKLANNQIAIGPSSSFGRVFDGTEDERDLQVIDLTIIGQDVIGLKTNYKIGTVLLNPQYVVWVH
jgi:hypothetical protein